MDQSFKAILAQSANLVSGQISALVNLFGEDLVWSGDISRVVRRLLGAFVDAGDSGSPCAIGVKVLKSCSVLALSPIFGQENPTQQAPKRTKKRWFVPGLRFLFVSTRSSKR